MCTRPLPKKNPQKNFQKFQGPALSGSSMHLLSRNGMQAWPGRTGCAVGLCKYYCHGLVCVLGGWMYQIFRSMPWQVISPCAYVDCWVVIVYSGSWYVFYWFRACRMGISWMVMCCVYWVWQVMQGLLFGLGLVKSDRNPNHSVKRIPNHLNPARACN